jgi:predicted nucleotidyltransferase
LKSLLRAGNRCCKFCIFVFVNSTTTLNAIKSTVNSFLPGSQVLLFGSRAIGQENTQSDYDLLIVTSDTYAPREKMNWENKIRKALVYSLNLPFDVILQSESEIDEKGNSPVILFTMP